MINDFNLKSMKIYAFSALIFQKQMDLMIDPKEKKNYIYLQFNVIFVFSNNEQTTAKLRLPWE